MDITLVVKSLFLNHKYMLLREQATKLATVKFPSINDLRSLFMEGNFTARNSSLPSLAPCLSIDRRYEVAWGKGGERRISGPKVFILLPNGLIYGLRIDS